MDSENIGQRLSDIVVDAPSEPDRFGHRPPVIAQVSTIFSAYSHLLAHCVLGMPAMHAQQCVRRGGRSMLVHMDLPYKNNSVHVDKPRLDHVNSPVMFLSTWAVHASYIPVHMAVLALSVWTVPCTYACVLRHV